MLNYIIGSINFEMNTDDFNKVLKAEGSNFFSVIDETKVNVCECELKAYIGRHYTVSKEFEEIKELYSKLKNNLSYTIAVEKNRTRIYINLNTENTFENMITYIDDCKKSNVYYDDPVAFRIFLDDFKC